MKSFSTLIFVLTSLFILTLQISFADTCNSKKYCLNVMEADLKSKNDFNTKDITYSNGSFSEKDRDHCVINYKGNFFASLKADVMNQKKQSNNVFINFNRIESTFVYTYHSKTEECEVSN